MARIWANRLIARDVIWGKVPPSRKAAVKKVLQEDVANEKITQQQYDSIVTEE
jgi:hypothetical protein